jgi:hypothetical protein
MVPNSSRTCVGPPLMIRLYYRNDKQAESPQEPSGVWAVHPRTLCTFHSAPASAPDWPHRLHCYPVCFLLGMLEQITINSVTLICYLTSQEFRSLIGLTSSCWQVRL